MKKYFLLSFVLICNKTIANTTGNELNEALAKNIYEPNYFSMILGLFVVVIMIYLTGYLYQKMTKINLKSNDEFINKAQIISTTSLGQGKSLHVIKIGEKSCLIGSTQNNITFLKDIELTEQPKEKNTKDDKNS